MALTVEQMFYGVWCRQTSDIPLVMRALYVQEPTVTRTQLGKSATGHNPSHQFSRSKFITSWRIPHYVANKSAT